MVAEEAVLGEKITGDAALTYDGERGMFPLCF